MQVLNLLYTLQLKIFFHVIFYLSVKSLLSTHVYMLDTKYGFAYSVDCAAQTMDPYFAGQSMDRVYLRA